MGHGTGRAQAALPAGLRLVIDQPHHLLYFVPPGGVIPGNEPITPLALRNLIVGSTVSSALGAVGYVGPDQEGGPDPNGPWGPVIRDMLIGLTVVQVASGLSDEAQGRQLRSAAARVVAEQANRLAQEIG